MNLKDLQQGIYRHKCWGGYRKVKLLLLEHFGKCYWCGHAVKDYGNIELFRNKRKIPDDMATLDHVKTRFERKLGQVVDKVLCCHKCNQRRARRAEIQHFRKQRGQRYYSQP